MLRHVPTLSKLPLVFEHYLDLVMKGEEMPSDSGLDWETVKTLKVIGRQGGNASSAQIAAAKAAFARSLEIGATQQGS